MKLTITKVRVSEITAPPAGNTTVRTLSNGLCIG
jgi:hypothetical protein